MSTWYVKKPAFLQHVSFVVVDGTESLVRPDSKVLTVLVHRILKTAFSALFNALPNEPKHGR